MDLLSLDDQERDILAVLAAQLLLADNEVTSEELIGVFQLSESVGQAGFYDAVMGGMSVPAEEALIRAKQVTKPSSRALIRDAIQELAEVDGLAQAEVSLLKRLDATWR